MWLMLLIYLQGDGHLMDIKVKDIKALPALYNTEAACLNATTGISDRLKYKFHQLELDCIKVESSNMQ